MLFTHYLPFVVATTEHYANTASSCIPDPVSTHPSEPYTTYSGFLSTSVKPSFRPSNETSKCKHFVTINEKVNW